MASTQNFAPWGNIIIHNLLDKENIQVENASTASGKFYDGNDMNTEISASEVDKVVIAPQREGRVCACGLETTPSTFEGEFDLYQGTDKIGHVYFYCPGGPQNKFTADSTDSRYSVSAGDWPIRGPFGDVNVYIKEKGI
ncbi:aegerolysin type hemolysin [Xylaria cf. heliscus]|nr:aegerolysin type hemolysin [Xylaria cf. heliscus]